MRFCSPFVDRHLFVIEILDHFIDRSLNGGLPVHPAIGVRKRDLMRDHLSDSMLRQLSLNEGDQFVAGKCVKLDPLTL